MVLNTIISYIKVNPELNGVPAIRLPALPIVFSKTHKAISRPCTFAIAIVLLFRHKRL